MAQLGNGMEEIPQSSAITASSPSPGLSCRADLRCIFPPQMPGPEFLCAATVSTESSFNHVSGPLGGQNQKEKFGGNLPSGGDLVICAE